ncbi:MAG: hypothetical protein RLZZ241_10 [Bacteroidota bacterium]|jgi:uroporphyrinogen-III synthase
MIQLLSTKELTNEQLALLPLDQIKLTQYNALEIRQMPGPETWSSDALHVFTSGNAVRACFPDQAIWFEGLDCCCVGPKTAALIRSRGHRVLCEATSAQALAELLIQKYSKRYIILYVGNRTLGVIPERLRAAGISFEELQSYQSSLIKIEFKIQFDIVLFFSPSGVKSFFTANPDQNPLAICLGHTTENEAKKHTKKYKTAPNTTVEAVLQTASALIRVYEYKA